MGDHQVPSIIDDIEHTTLVVRSFLIGREKIARHSVVSSCDERIPNRTRILASDKYFHY